MNYANDGVEFLPVDDFNLVVFWLPGKSLSFIKSMIPKTSSKYI
jgi:hypothetical protein